MVIQEVSPTIPTTIDRRGFSAAVNLAFSTELALRTKEGDQVRLALHEGNSFQQAGEGVRLENGETIQEFSSVAVAASRYSLSVQGDLNQDELNAIQELVRGIAPLAREFFARAEFDLNQASSVLSGSSGEIASVELALERVITATFTTASVHSGSSGNDAGPAVSENGAAPPADTTFNPQNIRDLPALVFASVEAEFESQASSLPKEATILRSLNDLMTYLREQLSEFLSPLKSDSQSQEAPAVENGAGSGKELSS